MLHQQAQALFLLDRALFEDGTLFAFTHGYQKIAYDAPRRKGIDVNRLAFDKYGRIGLEKKLRHIERLLRVYFQCFKSDEDAADHAHQFMVRRSEDGLIKIVHVKINEPVVALVGTVIFQVKVAANPGQGRFR